MNFWKEHTALRVFLIALFFWGWTMIGQMNGLLIMIVGLILLVLALAIYNKPFQDKKD